MKGLLLAATEQVSAGATTRQLETWEWSRLAQFDDPRTVWLGLGFVGVLVVAFVVWLYRREWSALPPFARLVFPLLRLIAWTGAALFFLGLEKRIDQEVVTQSEVVILVDTSQSMSVTDVESDAPGSRSAAIIEAFDKSPLLDELRQRNDVRIEAFDRDARRIAILPRRQVEETDAEEPAETTAQPNVKWDEVLTPTGTETRLGSALQNVLEEDRTAPLAGVVVLTDGGQNVGLDPLSLLENQDAIQAPIHTVGLGSTEPRRNVRVQDFSAPSRVYPDDRTSVNVSVHGEGFAGHTVEVQLTARNAGTPASGATLLSSDTVTFAQDQETLPLEFTIEPAEVGSLVLEAKLVAPREDQYAGDNEREVELEVVETSSRVLLIAGGPSRDYQFLRNQLYRDEHAQVDVWIQSAEGNISQEADAILSSFPADKETLYEYDCIVAFDPNWEMLDPEQVKMLESWVADEAGGLIVEAGPVYTLLWTQSPEMSTIRSLYPVEFQRRLTLLDDGLYGSKKPWPILFSREGEEARHLWLGDTQVESKLLWDQFPGVYGCYAVRGPKPGARVLGWYGDPDASISEDYPVYVAEHFYGSGRVFYLGSGELWRLRSLDPGYFEILTTRLIRHVSQGRLLKGSSRGRLLVEQDEYTVGDDVIVRAQLLTKSREPYVAEQVIARVVSQNGGTTNLALVADPNRNGSFLGQFPVTQEGAYRIELSVPDNLEEVLVRRIRAVTPDLEFSDTRRKEDLLQALSKSSQGIYYPNITAAVEGTPQFKSLEQVIPSKAETRILRGTPNRDFARKWNGFLLGMICSALCLEWLLRRLLKLA